MKLGFIGLGRMGSAMAANLLAAGHELTVYNRTKAKAEPLLKRGAHLAETPGDAARGEVSTPCLPTITPLMRRCSAMMESLSRSLPVRSMSP